MTAFQPPRRPPLFGTESIFLPPDLRSHYAPNCLEKERYKVNLDAFEGPLDLLLHLVSKEEVDIYDISIEHLTSQYMEFLDTFRELNLPLASEFLVMASQLLYIKSRALLPKHEQLPDEAEEADPRWDLIRQLLEYKKFKEAAQYLKESQAQQTSIYTKAFSLLAPAEQQPTLEEANVLQLVQAFKAAVQRFEEAHEIGEISDDAYSVREMIDRLSALLSWGRTLTFEALSQEAQNKQELIVLFLAILELAKLGKIAISQTSPFDDLTLKGT